MPAGTYEVELRLAEIDPETPPGGRVFDIFVNGINVSEEVDLAAESGSFAAARVHALVEGGQGIEIRFVAKNGEPIVNGILIRRR